MTRYLILILCVLAAGIIPVTFEKSHSEQPPRPAPLSDTESRIAQAYERNGSPQPVTMARATAKTKRPRLYTAIAIVESNGDPDAVGRVGEVTAWQIRQELHGPVGQTVDEHAKSAERILEELISESDGNLRQALCKYNGDRSGRYAAKVLRKVREI